MPQAVTPHRRHTEQAIEAMQGMDQGFSCLLRHTDTPDKGCA
jgi:hypothetical protein